LFPNNQILNINDTSFLTFNTIVTVTADVFADSRFTPDIQSSWVTALSINIATLVGVFARVVASAEGRGAASEGGSCSGGDSVNRWYCRCRVELKGRNKGRLRKWL